MAPSLHRQQVLGVPVHVPIDLTPEQTQSLYCQWIQDRIRTGQGAQVITCNAEMVMRAQQDPQFLAVVEAAELVTPDGAGVVWALDRQGIQVARTPGIELAETLLQLGAQENYRIAFLGGKPDTLSAAVRRWQQYHPELTLWSHHGYFSSDQEPQILEYLSQSQPQLVLVGLGSPRQELWIQAQRQVVPAAVWIGVGGSFDIWAGVKQRAPAQWRALHLEWLYRLYQEPWRWRRMLVLPQFAWQVLLSPLPQNRQTPHPGPRQPP